MVIRCKGLQRWRFPSSYLASISCWALTLHIMPGSHSVRVFIHPPVSKSNISSPKTIGNQCLCQQISPTQKWVKEKLPWCHKCMSSGFQDRLWQCEQNNKILSEPREEAEWLCSHWGDTALPMWFLQTAATTLLGCLSDPLLKTCLTLRPVLTKFCEQADFLCKSSYKFCVDSGKECRNIGLLQRKCWACGNFLLCCPLGSCWAGQL